MGFNEASLITFCCVLTKHPATELFLSAVNAEHHVSIQWIKATSLVGFSDMIRKVWSSFSLDESILLDYTFKKQCVENLALYPSSPRYVYGFSTSEFQLFLCFSFLNNSRYLLRGFHI